MRTMADTSFIKLNHNFINGTPSALDWLQVVWAKSGPKDYHPWDVTNDGRVLCSGEAADTIGARCIAWIRTDKERV